MIVFRHHQDERIRPSTVAENAGSFISSPASSKRIGNFLTSINSVSTPARFFVSAKTKFAGLSLRLPWRGVPRITGMKSGRSVGIMKEEKIEGVSWQVHSQLAFSSFNRADHAFTLQFPSL